MNTQSNCSYNLLEPRLLEYLDKKRSNFKSCIPLELIFSITDNDIFLIKKYLSNNINNQVYNDDIRTYDRVDLLTKDDTMKKEVEKDLMTKYKIFPPKMKYKYKIHNMNLPEKGYISEDEKKVEIENIEEIERYRRKLTVGLKDTNYMIGEDTFSNVGTTQGKKRKGYGMKNPIENYYQYVNNEKQKYEHIVLPFPRGGYLSRILNFDYKN